MASVGEGSHLLDPRSDAVPRVVRWSVLGLVALVAATRSPYILLHGRFFAEEGELHFANMYGHSFPSNLLYVQTRTGYYNLFADWGTWLASLVPLAQAPLVTTWLSFGLILTMVWVALAWPSDLLVNAGAKVVAAVLLVVGTLAASEVWLNTINGQTYLAVTALLLLFVRVDDVRPWRYRVGLVLLAVAGLSGLYTVALFPLFLIVAVLDKSVRRWGYAAILGVAGVIQGAVFLQTKLSGSQAASKTALPSPRDVFYSVAGWHIGQLLAGPSEIGKVIGRSQAGNTAATLGIAVLALGFVAFLGLLLWSGSNRRVVLLLTGALILIDGLVVIGDLKSFAGARYSVVPVGILTLMLIHGAATSKQPLLRVAAGAGVFVVMTAGLLPFWSYKPAVLRCEGCPDWAAEVRSYQAGRTTELRIWPYDSATRWVIRLPEHRTSSLDPLNASLGEPPNSSRQMATVFVVICRRDGERPARYVSRRSQGMVTCQTE